MTLAVNASSTDQDISAIGASEWVEREFPLGPRERPTMRFRELDGVVRIVQSEGEAARHDAITMAPPLF